MKNIITKNWLWVIIIIIILFSTTILIWKIFYSNKILTCEERVRHCLDLGSDKRAAACLSLLGINYKLDDSGGIFDNLFKESLKDICKKIDTAHQLPELPKLPKLPNIN